VGIREKRADREQNRRKWRETVMKGAVRRLSRAMQNVKAFNFISRRDFKLLKMKNLGQLLVREMEI
jgi:hypothetical protein